MQETTEVEVITQSHIIISKGAARVECTKPKTRLTYEHEGSC